jgi:hypothetical protein
VADCNRELARAPASTTGGKTMTKEELKLRPDEYPDYKHGFLAGYAGEDLKGGESLATFFGHIDGCECRPRSKTPDDYAREAGFENGLT